MWRRKPVACARVVALVVVVEPGLADGDAFGMGGEPHEVGGLDVQFLVRVMRMRADRAPDLVGCASAIAVISVELLDPGGDRHHAGDAGRLGARQHAVAIGGERGEIEMAVAVDQHVRLRRPGASALAR